jgi:hypothetical protein
MCARRCDGDSPAERVRFRSAPPIRAPFCRRRRLASPIRPFQRYPVHPTLRTPILILAGLCLGLPLSAQSPAVSFPAASPTATLKQRIGFTNFEVDYSRPSAKGRRMLGVINAFGVVWRTGANSATTISFDTAVTLNGARIPAGTYALFTIPGDKDWTIIIDRNPKQWGAFAYNPKDDVVRFQATPVTLPEPVETFTIDFNDLRDDAGTLNLIWETTRVPIHIQLDVVPAVLAQIKAALAAPGPKGAGFYYAAASFYFDHGQDLASALSLVDAMLARPSPMDFEGLYLKAKILAKQGDPAGAAAAARASRAAAIKANGPNDSFVKMNDALLVSLGE